MRTFFLFLFAFLTLGCFAQDIIVKKDGSVIQAKVSEIGTTDVKYKKWSNQEGPSYVIAKNDILAITYQNGEKEMFEESNTHETTTGPKEIEQPADANNDAVKAIYNKPVGGIIGLKTSDKIAKGFWGILGFTQESVLSNADIEICFVYGSCNNMIKTDYYRILLKNKTNSTIHFDLANCFRTQSGIGTYCYYTGRATTLSNGSASSTGGSVFPLPFVGIHSSSTSITGVSRTFDEKRIISIPPRGEAFVQDFKNEMMGNGKEAYPVVVEVPELFSNYLTEDGQILQEDGVKKFPSPQLLIGESRTFDEKDSPFHRAYMFSYSKDKEFKTYSTIQFELYMKQAFGTSNVNGNEGPKFGKYVEGFTPSTIVMVRAIGESKQEKKTSKTPVFAPKNVAGSRKK